MKSFGGVVASEAVIKTFLVDDLIALHDLEPSHHRDALIAADRSPRSRVRIVLDPQRVLGSAANPWLRDAGMRAAVTTRRRARLRPEQPQVVTQDRGMQSVERLKVKNLKRGWLNTERNGLDGLSLQRLRQQ